jgi:peptidoglycan-associated lipoprotein
LGPDAKVLTQFEEQFMVRLILAISVVVCMAACSTPFKLDSVPVEDRTGQILGGAAQAPGVSSSGEQSSVAAVNAGLTRPEALGATINPTVYFDYDSFVIRSEFQGLIESSARTLQSDRVKKVVLEGHTDERGGREYNLALGQKRADAVRRALSLLGVPEDRLESVSFGKEKPAVVGSTEAAMEKNRRAEISVR